MLANTEAKKVEACFATCLFERVCDAGLLLAQLQSDAFKPFLRQVTTVLDHGAVPVEDDQIIGVPDYLGLPMELTARLFRTPSRPDRELSTDVLFESVQGDVGQQRREHASLWRAGVRCDKKVVIKDPSLEPGFDKSVQGRARLQLAQEGCLVDAVETLGDVGVQGVLGLLLNRDEDRTDGILDRASGAESVAVGLEPRLPLRL